MEFKYEVGDTFAWCDQTRKIVARYKGGNGGNRYVVSYSEEMTDETVPECYIANNYAKIEPFFEEGKKYRQSGGREYTWTCHVVTEVLGRKIALMTYGAVVTPTIFEQYEFKDYREVK